MSRHANNSGLSLGFCKVKIHAQTPRESHDLNMDFCFFDYGFKKLCAMISMQE